MKKTMPKILAVIPARGGSKGIKKKNIALLAGKPLIYYTLEAARKSKRLNAVVVSTDSPEIAMVVKKLGWDMPFLRPKHLAHDKTPTLPALKHALETCEKMKRCRFDYIVVLQPTSPLRTARDIDAAITIMLQHPKADSLISCYHAEAVHPRIMYKRHKNVLVPFVKAHKTHRRQDFEELYVRNGAVYLMKRNLLMNGKIISEKPLLLDMPRWRSINIDSPEDIKIAGLLIKNRV